MKSFIIKSVVCYLLLATLAVGKTDAQQADPGIEKAQQMAKSFLEVHANEYVPLQKENTKVSNIFYAKQSGQTDIVRKLKDLKPDTLTEVQTSIISAQAKLASLKQLEQHLVALEKDPSLKDGFIKTAEEAAEKIKLERAAAYKPLNDRRSALYKKLKDDADEFSAIIKTMMKETGEHELTKGAKLKYNSFDTAYARTSTSFYDEHGQKIQFQIGLLPTYKADKKLGLFLKKYPIARKDSWGGYSILVGGTEVKISCRIKEWTQEQVETAADDLVDFEKLEMIIPVEK